MLNDFLHYFRGLVLKVSNSAGLCGFIDHVSQWLSSNEYCFNLQPMIEFEFVYSVGRLEYTRARCNITTFPAIVINFIR